MKTSMVCAVVILLAACDEKKSEQPVTPAAETSTVSRGEQSADAASAKPITAFDHLERKAFNQRAQERFTPLFWRSDANANQTLDPDELAVLVGPEAMKRSDFVDANGFTPLFTQTYEGLVRPLDESKLDDGEKKRRDLIQRELSQGMATLVETDFSADSVSAQDKGIATHLVRAAALIENLYAKQLGTDTLKAQLAQNDPMSAAVFFRNQGPWCKAPKTENDADCNALSSKPLPVSGLYPAEVQKSPSFCEKLSKEKNAKDLMGHFSTVVAADDGKSFKAVPYHQAYASEMTAIAGELNEAAAAIVSGDEAAFKAYLLAAAKAFTTNDWEPANEAWVSMGPQNSKWFLRIAPDEVNSEPCAWKAGFALQLARINPDSIEWQKKLEPVKGEMEKALASMAGAPYKARNVKFKLPDFIDVVLNAGDQRAPAGATVGQSLPNWGKVAERGARTVAMTNLYTDADSTETLMRQVSSVFCPATMAKFDGDAKFSTMAIVLHEAAHNLGPAHDYKVKGKVDSEVFGGPLASTLEELKAQSASMFFTQWLVKKGVIPQEDAVKTQLRDITWAFGHISRGMYEAGNKPKNYSQLASIQMGTLLKAGALEWKKDEKAANATDVGCFEATLSKWPDAVNALAKRALSVKASGNKKDAEAMKAEFVDSKGEWADLRDVITSRFLRAPRNTFVYSVHR